MGIRCLNSSDPFGLWPDPLIDRLAINFATWLAGVDLQQAVAATKFTAQNLLLAVSIASAGPEAFASDEAEGVDAEEGELPAIIYRRGTPSPGNLTPRTGEDALSFRGSISNPVGEQGGPVLGRPGERYFGVATSKAKPKFRSQRWRMELNHR
jgi:hypothetical protein